MWVRVFDASRIRWLALLGLIRMTTYPIRNSSVKVCSVTVGVLLKRERPGLYRQFIVSFIQSVKSNNDVTFSHDFLQVFFIYAILLFLSSDGEESYIGMPLCIQSCASRSILYSSHHRLPSNAMSFPNSKLKLKMTTQYCELFATKPVASCRSYSRYFARA